MKVYPYEMGWAQKVLAMPKGGKKRSDVVCMQ